MVKPAENSMRKLINQLNYKDKYNRTHTISSVIEPVQKTSQPKQPSKTVKLAVNAKMRVLRDFHIVNKSNEDKYRTILTNALDGVAPEDRELVLDRLARPWIQSKINSWK